MRKFDHSFDISSVWSLGDDWPERIDFPAVFGNDNPVELEVGSGKGLFLLRESQARPETNFVGIEWSKKFAQAGAARMVKRNLQNVRVVSADARTFILRIPDGVLSAAHIYFPDPWWKRRQRKHRIVEPVFIRQVARTLKPGTKLWIATDVEEYFGIMVRDLATVEQLQRCADPEVHDPEHDLDYLTHFERKYRKEGRPIFRAAFVRE